METIVSNGKDDTIEDKIKEESSEENEENEIENDVDDITPKWVEELAHEFEETTFLKITSCTFFLFY